MKTANVLMFILSIPIIATLVFLFVMLIKERNLLEVTKENLFTVEEAMKLYQIGYYKASQRAQNDSNYLYILNEDEFKADSGLMHRELLNAIK